MKIGPGEPISDFCIVDIVFKLAIRSVSIANSRHQREEDVAINLIGGEDVIDLKSSKE